MISCMISSRDLNRIAEYLAYRTRRRNFSFGASEFLYDHGYEKMRMILKSNMKKYSESKIYSFSYMGETHIILMTKYHADFNF